ncbi:metallopeptidase TldD-related protein [Jatrophihabitans sp.]|uniref:metallopeptidase TldD-related protein n=1 Tax=Jatrophihabitans sp. TaxID=1932789 RepID=UPI002BA9A4F5|nr:metallopeptidase TldD-related protein [Jatrophihabitans sp.]
MTSTTTTTGVRIQDLVEQALALSTASGCLVLGEELTTANLRWAGNSLTTNGQAHSRKLVVISIVEGEQGVSSGVVSRAVTGPDDLPALVAASEEAARSASPADDVSPLIEPYESSDDWDAPAANTGIEVFEGFAPALGRAFAEAEKADRLLYGFAEQLTSSLFLASSTGLRRRHDQPTGRLELNAKSRDLTRTAWAGAQTRDWTDIDVEAMAADLGTRLDWAATRIDLPAGRYETLLPPSAVADLMIYLYWTATARDAEEGRSVFAAGEGRSRIGETLSQLGITLRSDPAEPGMAAVPFQLVVEGGEQSIFDNGAPVPATRWIDNGVLANLQRTRNWAARTGQPFVPFVDNLIMTGPESGAGSAKSLAEMIAGTERGLLLTCLWYIRTVDPQTLLVTGLTRDGVYLIENGEVRGVVNNFRFNESPVDLLGRITEVGRTERTLPREWSDYFTRTAMPTLRVADFNFSTVSQAS